MRLDHAREVRNLLSDPGKLCEALGLAKGAKRSQRAWQIRCPAHDDREPSCSVRVAQDGTIAVRCHACGFTADAIGLAAHCLGMNARSEFRDVLAECAKLGGDHALAAEITGGERKPDRKPIAHPALAPEPPRTYPPEAEVVELWAVAGPVNLDPDASRVLAWRSICPDAATRLDAVRVLDPRTHWTRLPSWARHKGATWLETGHRMLVPMYDLRGRFRSLRAWRIEQRSDGRPKRLPPAGHRAAGLAIANAPALAWLRREFCPMRIVLTEGEPDTLTATTHYQDPVLGLLSGTWKAGGFHRAVPRNCEVLVATHNDEAGDKYAAEVIESVTWAPVWRVYL